MKEWIHVANIDDVIENAGACIKHGEKQIAIFNFKKEEWFSVQNVCPHWGQSVLSRGLIGSSEQLRKVACPLHKNKFNLATGAHLDGNDAYQLETYPIKVEDGQIFLHLDPLDTTAHPTCEEVIHG